MLSYGGEEVAAVVLRCSSASRSRRRTVLLSRMRHGARVRPHVEGHHQQDRLAGCPPTRCPGSGPLGAGARRSPPMTPAPAVGQDVDRRCWAASPDRKMSSSPRSAQQRSNRTSSSSTARTPALMLVSDLADQREQPPPVPVDGPHVVAPLRRRGAEEKLVWMPGTPFKGA